MPNIIWFYLFFPSVRLQLRNRKLFCFRKCFKIDSIDYLSLVLLLRVAFCLHITSINWVTASDLKIKTSSSVNDPPIFILKRRELRLQTSQLNASLSDGTLHLGRKDFILQLYPSPCCCPRRA